MTDLHYDKLIITITGSATQCGFCCIFAAVKATSSSPHLQWIHRLWNFHLSFTRPGPRYNDQCFLRHRSVPNTHQYCHINRCPICSSWHPWFSIFETFPFLSARFRLVAARVLLPHKKKHHHQRSFLRRLRFGRTNRFLNKQTWEQEDTFYDEDRLLSKQTRQGTVSKRRVDWHCK